LIRKVLGIDVASATWESNGTAMISFDPGLQTFREIQVPAITWPDCALTPKSLANAIDDYARTNGICAVALDGPQGWRDPSTPEGTPGVGRRCEYECRTQGKTGVYPTTFPANQRAWIEFCIDLFDELLDKRGTVLANPRTPTNIPENGYLLLECYPTSAWRSSGLMPLPGKAQRPTLDSYVSALANAYGLPPISPGIQRHDDVQAMIAAVVAVAVVGGPAKPTSNGVDPRTSVDELARQRRLEGFIWNVQPLTTPTAIGSKKVTRAAVDTVRGGAEVRVTQPVVDQVGRAGAHQAQIAIRNLPGGTKTSPRTISICLERENYTLVVGDTHAVWRSRQNEMTRSSFDRLFGLCRLSGCMVASQTRSAGPAGVTADSRC
jgi:hypothetical protein